ncbi:MAG: hypothetical protein WDZ88_03610 [Candidatus Paceibacterota bacterium]
MPNKKKQNNHTLGFSLLAVTAGALGAYFLYGTEQGKQKRKAVRGWALKAKGDVLDRVEKMKDISKDKYDAIVSSVIAKYEKMPDIDKSEIQGLASDLKSAWSRIEKGLKQATKQKKTPKKTSAKK